MSEMHSLGVSGNGLEGVNSRFVEAGLLKARDRSWAAVQAIRSRLAEGMTESEARKLALEVLAEQGAAKNWHQPWVRFGPGTLLSFAQPLQKDYRLKAGDPVMVDLGPVWKDAESGLEYEGDVGDTFIFGSTSLNPGAEKCIQDAKSLFKQAQEKWSREKPTGETLYLWLKEEATTLGYSWIEGVHGHRIGDFPHQKHSKRSLAEIDFVPHPKLWILEVQIGRPELGFGAFYEDLLSIA